MKPLKAFAIGAEVAVISTLAVSSYHVAFAGATGTTDWLAGAPLLTVAALEMLRLPIAFNLSRTKLMGFLLSGVMLAGLSVITFEAASMAYTNLITQRTRAVVEAERDLAKANNVQGTLDVNTKRYNKKVEDLNKELDAARKHQTEIAQTSVAQLPMPNQLPMPAYRKPAPQSVPVAQTCWYKKGGKYICNAADIARVLKENAEAERKSQEAYDTAQSETIKKNGETQGQVNQQNAEAQRAHDADVKTASDQVKDAEAKLAAVGSAPDMSISDKALEDAKQRVADARAMNPMYQVAAAWQKVPVQELTSDQFEVVKHWAVIALAGATAVTTAVAAIIASLSERGTGPSSKLNRMLRAWIARRRKPVYRDVPGPVKYHEQIVYQDVPGPETIKEVEVVKEVPGPIEYRPAPGPIEYRDVPGPERVVEKVVVKWVPYDVNTGLRIKSDGSLGEVANLRHAQ